MNPPETASAFKFTARHDGSSTFVYYCSFYIVLVAVGMCWLALVPVGGPASWTAIVCTLFVFGFGIVYLCGRTRRRFSEGYIFASGELELDDGIRRIRVPYLNVTSVHPLKHRLREVVLRTEVCLYWKGPGGLSRSAIAYPDNLEGFLEQLAARCPHLERSELCLFPRT